MFEKGVAIVYVSGKAAETARKIKDALTKAEIKSTVFTPGKCAEADAFAIKGEFRDFIRKIFGKFDAIVAVMASGIIIRAVAPLLKSKISDPAIVCVDVAGRFAVSLVSGHYGGANHLARLIADGINATAVVTTASEALGKKSIEELARRLHCKIVNSEGLKAVNAILVDGGEIALVFVGDYGKVPSRVFDFKVKAVKQLDQAVEFLKDFDGGIMVSRDLVATASFPKPVVVLKPKTVTVGVGARRNVDDKEVLKAVKLALKRAHVPLSIVNEMATVDIKQSSQGLINAAGRLGLELKFFSLETLKGFSHEDLSPDSEVVKKKLGVGGVCERAALLAVGGKARLILKKMKVNGVTVAVAEEE
ncbi:MAG: cobalt-precorrin 5A hydrolase [Candidatus Bathyarchaeales archaeon]